MTDSANSASAYATGHKSVVNGMGIYEDNTKDPTDDPRVENIIELAKRTRRMATGLVSTADITDATPAAFAPTLGDVQNRHSLPRRISRTGIGQT